jgi:hypothetical protein
VITSKGKGSYGLSLSFPRSLVKAGKQLGTPGLEWRISRSCMRHFDVHSLLAPDPCEQFSKAGLVIMVADLLVSHVPPSAQIRLPALWLLIELLQRPKDRRGEMIK